MNHYFKKYEHLFEKVSTIENLDFKDGQEEEDYNRPMNYDDLSDLNKETDNK